jgi:putative colanic acid biosynthesis acetyltransferase WcaF
VGATLFACSFHNWYGFRRMLLRAFGARIASSARIRPSVRVEIPWNLEVGDDSAVGDRAILYCLGPVRIGARVTISQGAHLCAGTHDYQTPAMALKRLPITIGDDAWIAAEAFVGPGVVVGEGAILGARSVAMRDLAPWGIYSGHPAVRVRDRVKEKTRPGC